VKTFASSWKRVFPINDRLLFLSLERGGQAITYKIAAVVSSFYIRVYVKIGETWENGSSQIQIRSLRLNIEKSRRRLHKCVLAPQHALLITHLVRYKEIILAPSSLDLSVLFTSICVLSSRISSPLVTRIDYVQ